MFLLSRFLRQEYDAQYGVKSHNVNLFWFVYGYPKPKITYYFNDEPIEMGGRYDCSYTRNGQATLFINKWVKVLLIYIFILCPSYRYPLIYGYLFIFIYSSAIPLLYFQVYHNIKPHFRLRVATNEPDE